MVHTSAGDRRDATEIVQWDFSIPDHVYRVADGRRSKYELGLTHSERTSLQNDQISIE
jgi:hypothetical protein